MSHRPAYAITSVDNALRLIEVLQRDGTLRVTDAAAEIGVAMSTAHRLLAMLCYRGSIVICAGQHCPPPTPGRRGSPTCAAVPSHSSSTSTHKSMRRFTWSSGAAATSYSSAAWRVPSQCEREFVSAPSCRPTVRRAGRRCWPGYPPASWVHCTRPARQRSWPKPWTTSAIC